MTVLLIFLMVLLILYIQVVVFSLIRHERRPNILESMLPPAIGMLSRLGLAAVVLHFSWGAFISDAAAPSATALIVISLPSVVLVFTESSYWMYVRRVLRDREGRIERWEPIK